MEIYWERVAYDGFMTEGSIIQNSVQSFYEF